MGSSLACRKRRSDSGRGMIPPRHADRLFGGIILLVAIAALALLGGMVWDAWRYYHPIARVTVEEVVDPAPVRGICEYIPKHRGCPEAQK
jgi:hypothetical protein